MGGKNTPTIKKNEDFGATKLKEPSKHYIDWGAGAGGGSGYFFPDGLSHEEKLLRLTNGASDWDRPFKESFGSKYSKVYIPQQGGGFKVFKPDSSMIAYDTKPATEDPRPKDEALSIKHSFVKSDGSRYYSPSDITPYDMPGLPRSPEVQTGPLSAAFNAPQATPSRTAAYDSVPVNAGANIMDPVQLIKLQQLANKYFKDRQPAPRAEAL
jgi:hypothetical protein